MAVHATPSTQGSGSFGADLFDSLYGDEGKLRPTLDLIEACRRQCYSDAEVVLNRHPSAAVTVLCDGLTPLHIAVENDHVDLVALMLKEPNLDLWPDGCTKSAVDVAIECRFPTCTAMLLCYETGLECPVEAVFSRSDSIDLLALSVLTRHDSRDICEKASRALEEHMPRSEGSHESPLYVEQTMQVDSIRRDSEGGSQGG